MGRPPIGKKAMTAAERQRKRRERLGIGGPYLRYRRPWDDTLPKTRREMNATENLEAWLGYGDKDDVTEWLNDALEGRVGRDNPNDMDAILDVMRPHFAGDDDCPCYSCREVRDET